MEIKKEFEKEMKVLKLKFPNANDDELVNSLDDSIHIYCSLKGKGSVALLEEHEKNWVKRCAIELLSRGANINIQSYNENGFGYSYFTGIISEELRNEIIPNVKTLRKATQNEFN